MVREKNPAAIRERNDCLRQSLEELRLKKKQTELLIANGDYSADTIRALSIVNNKIEVVRNRLSGRFGTLPEDVKIPYQKPMR